ncbi:MAG: hypothetical protein M1818_006622 [Claussenomyces sp. TS43310]|nr:MAG: hypothetical protein M1818_006943 [Claussenomyces sp. TS43310]KAI9735045.1 MAG: hypothetical protein M1818_006622 [Claussenomyces sp. TS43310]
MPQQHSQYKSAREEGLVPRKPSPASWSSLPCKDQLAILFFSRLVDFLQVASLQAYAFYQLRTFDTTLSVSEISSQAGILQGCYTAAQIATAILWGKVADASWGGRKLVLLTALGGTAVSCLGYGFATSFVEAAIYRILGGAINGSVGIIRTMISEITVEKKYQSRAFLLLPLSFNVANLLGPVMGGLLSEPATSYPTIFGVGSSLGFQWLETYPYALPSIINAIFLFIVTAAVFFGLEETLQSRRDRFDIGIHIAEKFLRRDKRTLTTQYESLSSVQPLEESSGTIRGVEKEQKATWGKAELLPFRRLWTRNVILTLITCTVFFDFHMGGFNNLWALHLSAPRYDPADPGTQSPPNLPFKFSGGLGMPSSSVGLATAIIGVLGMALQLGIYPSVHSRLGTMRCFRYSLLLYPVAYFLAPYLSILPSARAPPHQASGIVIWIGVTIVLFFQVLARTFALPATIILINNCSPHPSVLGTIHGLGQSFGCAFRTIGPVVAGYWYGWGVDRGVVGVGWWGIAGVSLIGCVTATWIYEGNGHEILLASDMVDEHDADDINLDELLADDASDRALSRTR